MIAPKRSRGAGSWGVSIASRRKDRAMKSIITKSLYAGLGLLGTGKETVEELGRKLAKKVNVSEKDGEKIARQLRARSDKAIHALQKTLDAEVNKVVHVLHAATHKDVAAITKKSKASAKPKAKPHKKAKANAAKAVH